VSASVSASCLSQGDNKSQPGVRFVVTLRRRVGDGAPPCGAHSKRSTVDGRLLPANIGPEGPITDRTTQLGLVDKALFWNGAFPSGPRSIASASYLMLYREYSSELCSLVLKDLAQAR
jgi:hypothetical protein